MTEVSALAMARQVLGQRGVEGAGAEADHLTTGIGDGNDEPVAETVVGTGAGTGGVLLFPFDGQAGFHQLL
jgi:hypothetical protein